MDKNSWYSIKDQSLAVFARAAGFDLSIYNQYSEVVKDELRSRTIKEALSGIRERLAELDCEIDSISTGVYVICLSNPLSIQYRKRRSQVIYIGMGNIINRLKSHFEKANGLFDFMESLSGANFDFYVAQPALAGTAHYYKHVEHLMLEHFCQEYGGLGDKKRFPILNSNAGSNKNFNGGNEWWKKPLKATGKKPQWELKPTSNSEFGALDSAGR